MEAVGDRRGDGVHGRRLTALNKTEEDEMRSILMIAALALLAALALPAAGKTWELGDQLRVKIEACHIRDGGNIKASKDLGIVARGEVLTATGNEWADWVSGTISDGKDVGKKGVLWFQALSIGTNGTAAVTGKGATLIKGFGDKAVVGYIAPGTTFKIEEIRVTWIEVTGRINGWIYVRDGYVERVQK
jgi:hypothetical protein